MKPGVLILFILLLCSCNKNKTSNTESNLTKTPNCIVNDQSDAIISKDDGDFKALKANTPVIIDGCGNDSIWNITNWYSMNYKWMGSDVDFADYHGKFKLAWDNNYLYVLVEIIDDYLNPTLENGLENYWKGDYVELFIDEDKSGGNHKLNHQAFAYHVSTEGHAIDKSANEKTIFLDDHINVKRIQEGHTYSWEMAIKLFDKTFDDNSTSNRPLKITNQKSIGFSIAYGDNDGKNSRENFMGSKRHHGTNNDDGYITADVFGSILFIE